MGCGNTNSPPTIPETVCVCVCPFLEIFQNLGAGVQPTIGRGGK